MSHRLMAWTFICFVASLDIFTFWLCRDNPEFEVNPIPLYVYRNFGMAGLVAIKAALLGYVLYVSRIDKRSARIVLPFLLSVYAALLPVLLTAIIYVM